MIEKPYIDALIPHRIAALRIDDDSEPGYIRLWMTDSKYQVQFFVSERAVEDPEFLDHWVQQVIRVFEKKRGKE